MQEIDEIKLLPEVTTVEAEILKHAIRGRAQFEEVYEHIKQPEYFYAEKHALIFATLLKLRNSNSPIDVHLVIADLKDQKKINEAGGEIWIRKFAIDWVMPDRVAEYCKVVVVKFMQRELIRICSEGRTAAYEEADVFGLVAKIDNELKGVLGYINTDSVEHIADIVKRTQAEIHERREKGVSSDGVPSGWSKLDALTGGWQPTDLIYLAARPSVGKTAMLLNLLLNAAEDQGKPTACLVFSLEMSKSQLAKRVLANVSGILLKKISKEVAQLTEAELSAIESARQRLTRAAIYIDDKGAVNLGHISSVSRKKVKRERIGLIAVDYLQLVTSHDARNKNREQVVSQISAGLKALAKDLNVPVIALAQLNRDADDEEPQLKHLRESGSIEQDADIVGMLHRPPKAEIAKDPSKADLLVLSIRKNRNGELDDIPLTFDKPTQRITQREFQAEFKAMAPPPQPTYQTGSLNFEGTAPKPKQEEDDTPF